MAATFDPVLLEQAIRDANVQVELWTIAKLQETIQHRLPNARAIVLDWPDSVSDWINEAVHEPERFRPPPQPRMRAISVLMSDHTLIDDSWSTEEVTRALQNVDCPERFLAGIDDVLPATPYGEALQIIGWPPLDDPPGDDLLYDATAKEEELGMPGQSRVHHRSVAVSRLTPFLPLNAGAHPHDPSMALRRAEQLRKEAIVRLRAATATHLATRLATSHPEAAILILGRIGHDQGDVTVLALADTNGDYIVHAGETTDSAETLWFDGTKLAEIPISRYLEGEAFDYKPNVPLKWALTGQEIVAPFIFRFNSTR